MNWWVFAGMMAVIATQAYLIYEQGKLIKAYRDAIDEHNAKQTKSLAILQDFNSGRWDDEVRKQGRAGAN